MLKKNLFNINAEQDLFFTKALDYVQRQHCWIFLFISEHFKTCFKIRLNLFLYPYWCANGSYNVPAINEHETNRFVSLATKHEFSSSSIRFGNKL